MTTLYIVRGIPGSGKSTYARLLNTQRIIHDKPQMAHYEADQFFDGPDGYQFDPRLLRVAHAWCFGNVVKALREGQDTIVSNTFTRLSEMVKYLEINDLVDDVQIKIVELKTQYGNVHNVPEDKLKQMAERWEEIPEDMGFDVITIEAE